MNNVPSNKMSSFYKVQYEKNKSVFINQRNDFQKKKNIYISLKLIAPSLYSEFNML